MSRKISALWRPKRAGWFDMHAMADNQTTEIDIYDEIGMWGIMASDFVAALKQVTSPKILVRLNTPGGDVFDGLAIHNALLHHPAEVTTQIDGLAASIGSIIALAGDKRTAASNAFAMVHNPWTFAIGDARELRDLAATLDKVQQTLADMYQASTGASAEQVKQWMDDETWFTAQEALDAGLVDEIMPEPAKMAAEFDLSIFAKAPKELVALMAKKTESPAPAAAPANVNIMRQRLQLKRRRLAI